MISCPTAGKPRSLEVTVIFGSSNIDREWYAQQRRELGKTISRRTKLANYIRNELAPLAKKLHIDLKFESCLVERDPENRDNWFKISVLDYSLDPDLHEDFILLQIVVWQRRDVPRPFSLFKRKYCPMLEYVRAIRPIACFLDNENDANHLIATVRQMVEEHIARRK